MQDSDKNAAELNSNAGASIQPTAFDAPSGQQTTQGFKWNWRYSLIAGAVIAVLLTLFFMLSAKALLITTNAEDTDIALNGGTSVRLGEGRYLVMKGSYTLSLSAAGYHPSEIELLVDSETLSNLRFDLRPLPGRIHAQFAMGDDIVGVVRLDGMGMGPANEFLFKDLEVGEYQLQADAYLYAPASLRVAVQGRELTEEVALQLEPNWGYLSLDLDPPNAEIYAGSQRLETPFDRRDSSANSPVDTAEDDRIRIETGRSKLRITADGYKTFERDIDIAKEQHLELGIIRLEPVDTQVSIQTDPLGVSVTVNNQYAGQTPITLDLLPDVDHQLKLFKAGYVQQQHQLNIAKNSVESRDYKLDADLVNVSISTSPSNAQIRIDGAVRGQGSVSLPLTSIKHQIQVVADGYEPQTMEFLPVRGSRQLLQVSLLTDEQALWANTPAQYVNAVGNKMLLFRDSGEVPMGSSRREPGRRANEVQWMATIARAFYVSSTETTNDQYRQYQSEHSSGHFEKEGLDGPNRPAVNMSWQNAALFCNWLSKESDIEPFYTETNGFVSGVNPDSSGYRLLTEAEWAFLAKITPSGLAQRYIWGDSSEAPPKIENFADQSIADKINFVLENSNDGFPVSAPVASFAPNQKGIYDLGGNVMEWVNDWYQPVPYEREAKVTDPLGPNEGEFHVIRGASWARGYLPQLRLSYRDYDSKARNDLGFRVARYAM